MKQTSMYFYFTKYKEKYFLLVYNVNSFAMCLYLQPKKTGFWSFFFFFFFARL